jgi:hypothetical protein
MNKILILLFFLASSPELYADDGQLLTGFKTDVLDKNGGRVRQARTEFEVKVSGYYAASNLSDLEKIHQKFALYTKELQREDAPWNVWLFFMDDARSINQIWFKDGVKSVVENPEYFYGELKKILRNTDCAYITRVDDQSYTAFTLAFIDVNIGREKVRNCMLNTYFMHSGLVDFGHSVQDEKAVQNYFNYLRLNYSSAIRAGFGYNQIKENMN